MLSDRKCHGNIRENLLDSTSWGVPSHNRKLRRQLSIYVDSIGKKQVKDFAMAVMKKALNKIKTSSQSRHLRFQVTSRSRLKQKENHEIFGGIFWMIQEVLNRRVEKWSGWPVQWG